MVDEDGELLAWLPRFGHLRTLALPVHLPTLNAQLHEWRRTLASTCNHRRHALTNLVRILYGRRASFDLLDLVRFAPPPPKPRWVDRRHIADVLAQLTPGSVTRVRLELMHWTGMRPSQMGRLRDEDFRLDEPIPYVAVPRGKGGRIAAVPLVPEGLGIDPIHNLAELLEGRGIKVLSISLTTIDALTARVRRVNQGLVSVIVVNRTAWGERQRFTLAHELGHMALTVAAGIDAEKAAHRFAGAFLMPAETVRAEIGSHRRSIGWNELFELKKVFGVSVQALAYRCRDLGIFNAALYQRLFRDFSRFGWRSPPYKEPLAMPGEKPRRFKRLCWRALAEGAISETRAAEVLGVPVYDLSHQMQEPPDTGNDGAR